MNVKETTSLLPLPGENRDVPQRILVVDDEPAVLFAYRKLIEREGIEVDSSTNLQGAIKNLKTNHYLAVITDLRLEGTENTDGLKIINAGRENQPGAKLIMVTGYGNTEIEQMAFASGVTHYFEKPVRPSLILDALKPLIG